MKTSIMKIKARNKPIYKKMKRRLLKMMREIKKNKNYKNKPQINHNHHKRKRKKS